MQKLLLSLTLALFVLSGCTTHNTTIIEDTGPTAAQLFDDGKNLYNQSQYDAAINSFNEAVRIDPSYADAHYWAGRSYEKLNNNNGAVSSYKAALDIQPGHADANFYLGVVYFNTYQYTPAEAHLQKSKAVDAANPYSYYYLAEIYKKQGKCKLPKTLYNKALSLKSDLYDAKEGLAYVAKNNCKPKKPAAKKFEKVNDFRGGGKALKESEW